MNALVGVGLGTQEPTRAQRDEVVRKVATQFAGVRQQTQAANATKSATQTKAASTAATDTTGATNSTTDTSSGRVMGSELDKQAFLQLLIFQLQNQDPLNPTDNAQMVAQLAQFSSLEQMNNLNASFKALSGNVDQLSFLSANSLIGRTVSGVDAKGAAQQGTVTRVVMDGTNGIGVVVGDATLPLNSILRIE